MQGRLRPDRPLTRLVQLALSPLAGWQAPLDTPIRGYQRYEEGPDGKVIPVQAPASSPKCKKPFEAELALLRELGLR